MQQVAQRDHARLNERALLRDPLSLSDYLESRWVSRPVRLLDCDYPCDASGAVILTTEERARDLRKSPVFLEAAALAAIDTTSWEYLDNILGGALVPCAQALWSRTDLGPADVDCAQLYDGFSVFTLCWLEALGFCSPGEAGPFIADGHTALGGTLPLNTDGGVCNVGRHHGSSHCIEAVHQLRGECGARQVPGAEVSLYTAAHGSYGTARTAEGSWCCSAAHAPNSSIPRGRSVDSVFPPIWRPGRYRVEHRFTRGPLRSGHSTPSSLTRCPTCTRRSSSPSSPVSD